MKGPEDSLHVTMGLELLDLAGGLFFAIVEQEEIKEKEKRVEHLLQ